MLVHARPVKLLMVTLDVASDYEEDSGRMYSNIHEFGIVILQTVLGFEGLQCFV